MRLLSTVVACLTAAAVSAEGQTNEPLALPALGRSFALGDLYDVRDERHLALSLWNSSKLHGLHVTEEPTPFTHTKLFSAQTRTERFNLLDVSVELALTLSVVTIKGSAAFAQKTKTSNYIASIGYMYRYMSHTRRLNNEQLFNIDYDEIFDRDIATHVVSKIEYGSEAIMDFSVQTTDHDQQRNVSGALTIAASFIPGKLKAKLVMGDQEHKMNDVLKLEFYGDFKLNKTPTSYDEATQLIQRLPLISHRNNSVPKIVHLIPLSILLSREAKMVQNIKKELITRSAELMDRIETDKATINDIRKLEPGTMHSQILLNNLDKMDGMMTQFRDQVGKKLVKMLPPIRRNECPVTNLSDMLLGANGGPVKKERIKSWLAERSVEARALDSIAAVLTKDRRIPMGAATFAAYRADVRINFVVALEMRLRFRDDPFLTEISDFLELDWPASKDDDTQYKAEWLLTDYRSPLAHFIYLFDSLQRSNNTKFVAYEAECSGNAECGFSVHVYDKDNFDYEAVELPEIKDFEMTREGRNETANWVIVGENTTRVEVTKVVLSKPDIIGNRTEKILLPSNQTSYNFPPSRCLTCQPQIFMQLSLSDHLLGETVIVKSEVQSMKPFSEWALITTKKYSPPLAFTSFDDKHAAQHRLRWRLCAKLNSSGTATTTMTQFNAPLANEMTSVKCLEQEDGFWGAVTPSNTTTGLNLVKRQYGECSWEGYDDCRAGFLLCNASITKERNSFAISRRSKSLITNVGEGVISVVKQFDLFIYHRCETDAIRFGGKVPMNTRPICLASASRQTVSCYFISDEGILYMRRKSAGSPDMWTPLATNAQPDSLYSSQCDPYGYDHFLFFLVRGSIKYINVTESDGENSTLVQRIRNPEAMKITSFALGTKAYRGKVTKMSYEEVDTATTAPATTTTASSENEDKIKKQCAAVDTLCSTVLPEDNRLTSSICDEAKKVCTEFDRFLEQMPVMPTTTAPATVSKERVAQAVTRDMVTCLTEVFALTDKGALLTTTLTTETPFESAGEFWLSPKMGSIVDLSYDWEVEFEEEPDIPTAVPTTEDYEDSQEPTAQHFSASI